MNAPHSEQDMLQVWMACLVDKFQEVSASALGIESCAVTASDGGGVKGELGGFIPMVGEDTAVQIAVISSENNCRDLSALLLGMEPEEASELSEEDIDDGIGEFMNIIAGSMKTEMVQYDSSTKLGLPFIVHGWVAPGSHTMQSFKKINCGELTFTLMVLSSVNKMATKAVA